MSEQTVPLSRVLRTHAPLAPGVALALAHRLVGALAEAERTGVGHAVHGGRAALTPDSFVARPDGRFVVRTGVLGDDDRPGFRTWAAPEQLGLSTVADGRAWLFSLAAILYEAATGEALFEAPSPPAVNALVTDDLESHLMLQDVEDRFAGIHPALSGPLHACLAADPDARPDDVAALRATLPPADPAADVALATFVADTLEDASAPDPFATPTHPAFVDAHGGFDESLKNLSRPDLPRPDSIRNPQPAPQPPPEPEPAIGLRRPPRSQLTPPPPAPGQDPDDLSVGGQSFELALDIGRRSAPPTAAEPPAPPPAAAPPHPPQDFELALSEPPLEDAPPLEDEPHPFDPAPAPTPRLRSTQAPPPAENARVRPIREVPPALVTFVRRAVFLLLFLLLSVGAIFLAAWLGALPALPPGVTGPAESLASTIGGPLPASMRAPLATAWAERDTTDRGRVAWRGFVSHLPEDLQRSLLPPVDPRTEVTWVGTPTADGVVDAVFGRLEPDPGSAGLLDLSLSHAGAGSSLSGDLRWTATPADDPRLPELAAALAERFPDAPQPTQRAPRSGTGTDPIPLAAGFWDVALAYDESPLAGGWEGTLRGLRVEPGHIARYSATLDLPVGALAPRVLVDGEDANDRTLLAVYAPDAGAAVRAAEEADHQAAREAAALWFPTVAPPTVEGALPLWSGPLAEVPALPAGPVLIRASWSDEAHHPSAGWASATIPENLGRAEVTLKLELQEPLHPTGPGVRVRATNRGRDVSRYTDVFLYEPGSDIDHGAASFQGRAGRYFDADPGTWDLRLVYTPPGAGMDVYGQNVVAHFVVRDAGVTETTVDIGFATARLSLAVQEGGEDVSDDVQIRVMRVGVDPVAGNPVLDEMGVGEHVLPADTYDIYLLREGRTLARFGEVDLPVGARWTQSFDVGARPWTAAPAVVAEK